jgi:hypothetical protein
MSPSQPTKPTWAWRSSNSLGIRMSQMALTSMNRELEAKVMTKQARLVFTKRRMTGGMKISPLYNREAKRVGCLLHHVRERAGV